ncbi:MAG: hypothetical protein SW833_11490 [Cyanobacteriota bacterium]|nr:hypothetical protein [Cyanobacteriota bacterium]
MTKVAIWVESEMRERKRAIASLADALAPYATSIKTIEVDSAAKSSGISSDFSETENVIHCPLTLNLPSQVNFPAKKLYRACGDVRKTREWVEKKLNYRTAEGNLWLPVALTAKGPLYGEAIAAAAETYRQPAHLSDSNRQPLYHLAYKLLEGLGASPAVYLLQFRLEGSEILFDRLYPFPAEPAIASLGVQQPDLFACHGLCAIGQPLLDLTIV